ncbi:MAG: hypothetical protein IPL98_14960 [Saprospiraceae bacterium]|nr:hypothetical protein [Saprospiraceae bacterium]
MEKGSIRRPKYEAIFDQSVSLVGASSGITASIDDKTIVSLVVALMSLLP